MFSLGLLLSSFRKKEKENEKTFLGDQRDPGGITSNHVQGDFRLIPDSRFPDPSEWIEIKHFQHFSEMIYRILQY